MKSNHSIRPCNFDHNGECLICDCWIDSCAFQRLLYEDYKWENREELIEMFKPTFEEFFKIYDLGYEAGDKDILEYDSKYSFVFVIGYCDARNKEDKFYKNLERRDELMEMIIRRLVTTEMFSNVNNF